MSPPLKVDQIAVSPTVADTLLITKTSGGNLTFTDNVISSGITLKKLSGMNLTNLITVGTGSGANYASIQEAVDAAPTTSTLNSPTIILIYSGVYSENIVIEKDGLIFVGIGRVIINSAADDDTLILQPGLTTIPLISYFENISFRNSFDARSCFRILGDSGTTLGLNGFRLKNCSFVSTGLGGYCVRAHILNSLTVTDSNCHGSVTSSTIYVSQCANLYFDNFLGVDLSLTYTTLDDIPSEITSTYFLNNSYFGDALANLVTVGELEMNRTTTKDVVFDGNMAYTMNDCYGEALEINGSITVISNNSKFEAISGSPTAVLITDNLQSSVDFVAESTKIIVFPVPTSDTNYMVLTSHSFVGEKEGITKTTSGFTIDFVSNQTGQVDYLVRR